MNCDNKYATCCGCPAILNSPRELTEWSSAKLYNIKMMKKMNTTNSHDYRASLQANAESIMKNTVNDFETNYKCKSSAKNTFYLDSSVYNAYYDNVNTISAKPEVQKFQKNAKTMSVSSMSPNMTLSSISFSPMLTNVNSWKK